jgi:hypothetical protein
MQVNLQRWARGAKTMLDTIGGLTREESRIAYEWMHERDADGLIDALPAESKKSGALRADVSALLAHLLEKAKEAEENEQMDDDDESLGLGPIQSPKQQHASSTLTGEALAICPVAAAGLMPCRFKGLQPSQMGWDHRIKLRLRHHPLFQLHKPGHRSRTTFKGLVA